mmetsp:Transcript_11113/g.15330  ORF Transcript_11113/g.15330 Transcript_11113/m.15330 type:complete len:415 (-) Transcript_11113:42-1286(-)
MAVAVQLSDLAWLQTLGYLKDVETVAEVWNKLVERCNHRMLEIQIHNEADKLRSFIKEIQETVLPKLKYERTLVIDRRLGENNPFPNLLEAIWRVEPDLPYPETAIYLDSIPEINHLPYLTQLKHLNMVTGPQDAPDYELFPLLIDAVGVTLESLRFNPFNFPGNLKEVARCPHLTKLTLENVEGIIPDIFLSAFGSNSSITELVLEYGFPALQESDLKQLKSALPKLAALTAKCACQQDEKYPVEFLQYFPHVSLELSLWQDESNLLDSQCNLVSLSAAMRNAEDVKKLAKFGQLKQVYLAYMNDQAINNLASIGHDLKTLRLYNCNAMEESFVDLAKKYPNLEHLELIKGSFNDNALKAFTDNCHRLKKVLARDCQQLTEEGLRYYAEKKHASVELATPSPNFSRRAHRSCP